MSPIEIEILLHYHHSLENFPRQDAPAVKEAIAKFLKHGILLDKRREGSPTYQVNRPALDAYVKAVCSIPLPHQEWVIDLKPKQ